MFTSKKQRALQEIEARRGRIETYTEPLPIDTATDIPDFLSHFYRHILFQQRNDEGIQLELQLHAATTGKFYNELVLQQKTIAYEDFWQRYFYRTNSVERVMNELDVIEKKKARPSKFPWRSSSSNTTGSSNVISANNSMDSDTGGNAQQSQPSLSDLIPQRVLSTGTTASSSSSSASTKKTTIFNDLLPKRQSRSSRSPGISPAASNDPELEDHAPPPPPPPPIAPIILDLHDEPDDTATTTTTMTAATAAAVETLEHLSEPTEAPTFTDESFEATTETDGAAKNEKVEVPHDEMDECPDDDDDDDDAVPHITSSSSLDVVDATTAENVVEVTPKHKVLVRAEDATISTEEHNPLSHTVRTTTDGDNDNDHDGATTMEVPMEKEAQEEEGAGTEAPTLEPLSEVHPAKRMPEVVPLEPTSIAATMPERSDDNNSNDDDASWKNAVVTPNEATLSPEPIPPPGLAQPLVPQQHPSEEALNMLDEVTRLCCSSSMDDDVIRDTTNVVTEAIVATTTTVLSDMVGVTPPVVMVPDTTTNDTKMDPEIEDTAVPDAVVETLVSTESTVVSETKEMSEAIDAKISAMTDHEFAAPAVIYDEDIVNGTTTIPVTVTEEIESAPLLEPTKNGKSSIIMTKSTLVVDEMNQATTHLNDVSIPTIIPPDDVDGNNDNAVTPSDDTVPPMFPSAPHNQFTDEDFLKAIQANNEAAVDKDFSLQVAAIKSPIDVMDVQSSSAESVAALMVELPKRVPTNDDTKQPSNHPFLSDTNLVSDPPSQSVVDTVVSVVNPFDDLLASGVPKIESVPAFNETIDSMPLTPDVYQSWNTSADDAILSTTTKNGVSDSLYDAFDPFATTTPRENFPTTESTTLLVTESERSAMEYIDKIIYEEFRVEPTSDAPDVKEAVVVETTHNAAIDLDPQIGTTDVVVPSLPVATENETAVDDTERGKVLKSWNTDPVHVNSMVNTEVTTLNEKETANRGSGTQVVGLGRRLGDLFSSKKRKQSMDTSDLPVVLEGFPSPKIAKHTNSIDITALKGRGNENNVESDDDAQRNTVGRSSLSKDTKPEYTKSLIPEEPTMNVNSDKQPSLDGSTVLPKQVPVSVPNREIRGDLGDFFKSISADDDREAHLLDNLKALEVTETDLDMGALPRTQPGGADSRAPTPVTSNVDLAALDRSNNLTGSNGSTNGNFQSFRSVVVTIVVLGVVTAVVAQQWPWILVATAPMIDQLCGPVRPGWSSTDHSISDVMVAEAPYWVPTNNTSMKHDIFQLICGTDRVRTVMKVTPTNNKDLYFFELLEATASNVTNDKQTKTLIKKQKIRAVHVSSDQIALTRPRGKVEWFHPIWVTSTGSTRNNHTATTTAATEPA